MDSITKTHETKFEEINKPGLIIMMNASKKK